MGAINYKRSEFITIGLKLWGNKDFSEEAIFCHEAALENIKTVLSRYDFYYLHVTIKPGYYAGFYIDIEETFGLCYNCYAEKLEALKEVTQLKKFLIECTDYGLCEVHPGWCTTYLSREDTIRNIRAAMKELKMKIKSTPTCTVLDRQGAKL